MEIVVPIMRKFLINSPYAKRIGHGVFQSVENQIAEIGLYFIQYYPFSGIRFINSFQILHDLSFLRKVSD
jgi:hypothetical protein